MKFAIIGNLKKPGLCDAVSPLVSALIRAHGDFLLDNRIAELLRSAGHAIPVSQTGSPEQCVMEGEMLIAFGGDGTILSAARLVGEVLRGAA